MPSFFNFEILGILKQVLRPTGISAQANISWGVGVGLLCHPTSQSDLVDYLTYTFHSLFMHGRTIFDLNIKHFLQMMGIVWYAVVFPPAPVKGQSAGPR